MYKCEICSKIFERKMSLVGHKRIHNGKPSPPRKKLSLGDKNLIEYVCKYCGHKSKSGLSLGGHISSCKLNPCRSIKREKFSASMKGRQWSSERKRAHSEAMRRCVLNGNQKTPSPGGITRGTLFTDRFGNKCYLQGSWEVAVARFFDSEELTWLRNKTGFDYIYEGKIHRYFPDFYLNDLDCYVEVKGFETEKDREKWKQFQHKLSIIKYDEYQNLSLWLKNLKEKYSICTVGD